MMPPQRLALASLLFASVFVVQAVLAEVNSKSIDLSRFKLRHVDTHSMTKQRTGQNIEDLATGALHMRESLFVDCNYIKCPAYAYLFKLIKRQDSNLEIKQGTIESLALVVTYDRVFYHKIFVENAQAVSADQFIEALSSLEADSKNEASISDTWLDLAACLRDYMSAGRNKQTAKRVKSFLREPKRAKALASLKEFKAIPIDVGGEQTPAGLVPNLAGKFDKGRAPSRLHFFGHSLFSRKEISDLQNSQRHDYGADIQTGQGRRHKLCANMEGKFEPGDKMVPASKLNPGETQNLNEARKLIESLDDEQTAEARRSFAANPTEAAKEMAKLVLEASKEDAAIEAAAKEAQKNVDLGLGSEATADWPVELIVPTEDIESLFGESTTGANSDVEDQDSDDEDQSRAAQEFPFSLLRGLFDESSSDNDTETETGPQDLDGSDGFESLNGSNADASSSLEGSQESAASIGDSSAAGSLSTLTKPIVVGEADIVKEAAALAVLKFVKMRLEAQKPSKFERAPTISMKLAFNFATHWRDLHEALPLLDAKEYGDFIERAREFLDNEETQEVAHRIKVALENYTEMTMLVEEIVQKRRYKTIEEFRRPFERWSSLLEKMDPSFDVDDLRRFHIIWRQRYQEVKTINNFIDLEFGR